MRLSVAAARVLRPVNYRECEFVAKILDKHKHEPGFLPALKLNIMASNR